MKYSLCIIAFYAIWLPSVGNAQVSQHVLDSISTPNEVDTSIGTLKFLDGAPLHETAEKVYDFLDTSRAMDAFLKGQPACSVKGLIDGARSIGAVEAHEVMIFDKLMNSKSLFLTGNTSTLYAIPDLDLKRDGPTVVEVPDNLLGAANDAYFRYINDLMKAGKYLYLPPGYEGEIPEGYTVVRPRSYRVWVFLRASIADGLGTAGDYVKQNLKVYPLSKASNPPEMKFISGSDKSFNTIHPNNDEFYHHLDDIIQYEPLGWLDPETRGLFAAIGIEKGKAFAPDERMKKILADGVAIGNAASRSIVWYPRYDMNMKGIRIYPDTNSSWIMGFLNRNVFFDGPDGRTMNSDARVMFYYSYTAVTPAMAKPREGTGSDYGISYVDADKQPFDGSKTYKLRIPADPPVNNFWAVTIYDPQTRSMLQTSQPFPTVGSQTKGIKKNDDGSTDIYFAPTAPEGYENNWLETIPGKSWFVILRMYGPLKPWLDQTWRPSEVELVK
ncbi:hypothetical protein Pla22_28100 [Rubripirellula amarantea]|uniref:DUF1254 domain-containing protein n=1 Tax=Rubripirellula amarantea TaxID=2527999 RepID=A0A5C5WWR9_9BACT|nr:DUF1254 domain-containing protein [Rubripirellula amarantea]TWT55156.1 hypothetical protein Pla22_28100 [Rubripirellula amarantea]